MKATDWPIIRLIHGKLKSLTFRFAIHASRGFKKNMDFSASDSVRDISESNRKLNTVHHDPRAVAFGDIIVAKDTLRYAFTVSLVLFFLTVAVVSFLNRKELSSAKKLAPPRIASIEVTTGHELMAELKNLNLWEIEPNSTITPVILANYPANIDQLEVKIKKKAFLNSLLPVAMIALKEIEREREILEYVIEKIDEDVSTVDFADHGAPWFTRLNSVEADFILQISAKYRTTKPRTLLRRVNVIPVSLILAQGAIESSWGSSRFAQEGNNLFGIWTWGEHGMIPLEREEGSRHKVAAYPTILESVRAYLLTLNRLPSYRTFRDIREKTMDSLHLADGLHYYSERRGDYVRDVKRFIRMNKLTRYDTHELADNSHDLAGMMQFTALTGHSNASL